MNRILHNGRLATICLTVLVVGLGAAVCKQALAVTETLNAAFLNYSVAPGGKSAAYVLPYNVPVLAIGVQTTPGFRGVGSATLLSIQGSFVEWVGLESPYSSSITSGFGGSSGTHIVYLDFSHYVDLEVYGSDEVNVVNSAGSPYTATGTVHFAW